MSRFGDSEAVVFHDTTYTYPQLTALADDWRAFLHPHDIRRGEAVTPGGGCSPLLGAGLLALIERQVVVVPLTVLPDAKRAEFLDVAQVETVIPADGEGGRELRRTGRQAEHELYTQLRDAGH